MTKPLAAQWTEQGLEFVGVDGGFPSYEATEDSSGEATDLLTQAIAAARYAGAELLTNFADVEGGETVVRWLFAHPASSDEDARRPEAGPSKSEIVVLRARPRDGRLPSAAVEWPILAWYERLMRDDDGLEFEGHPDPRPIRVHDATLPRRTEHSGLVALPLGPVREGVVESGHFQLETMGEEIVHLGLRLHYKHRGVEQAAVGLPPRQAVWIAERTSGLSSVAHALAASEAIERAADLEVPERARWLRLVLQEAERLYNHVGDIAGLARAAGLSVAEAELSALKEELLRANAELSGSRYLRGLVGVGGLRHDVADRALSRWQERAHGVARRFSDAARALQRTPTFIDRIETTGRVSREDALLFGAVGPVARASGLSRDARVDTPHGAYANLLPSPVVEEAGDALARYRVRVREIEWSVLLIDKALRQLPGGPVASPNLGGAERATGTGVGWSESPRGRVVYWVRLEEGRIARFKPRAASFHNWRLLPHAVPGNILTDFPLIEASFALSYAGNDL